MTSATIEAVFPKGLKVRSARRPSATSGARILGLVLALAVVCGVPAARAHHSFAMFDKTKKLTLVGVVSKFEWSNPHASVIVDVTDGKDKKRYTFECSSPNLLSRQGWKASTLKVGDPVTVTFYPLRNGEAGGMLSTVKLPDGAVKNAW